MPLDLRNAKVNDTFLFGKYQVESEDPWEIEWEVVDDTNSEYVIAQTKSIIDLRAFDAKESSNTDSNRRTYGNNNWKYSNIKQFLNSDSESWYSAQHQYDAPPSNNVYKNPYDTHKGFLYYFSDTEKSYLQDMTLTLANPNVDGKGSYTWTGKVWLPTYTQLTGKYNNSINEGTQFNKYTDNNSRIKYIHEKCAENNTYCIDNGYSSNDSWYYWMSSARTSYSYYVRYVNSSGATGSNDAYNGGDGLAPCIKLLRYLDSSAGINSLSMNPSCLLFLHKDRMVYIRQSDFIAPTNGVFDLPTDVNTDDIVYKIKVITNFSATDPLKITIKNSNESLFSQDLYCNDGVSSTDSNYLKSSGNTRIVLRDIPDSESLPTDAKISVILYCKRNL